MMTTPHRSEKSKSTILEDLVMTRAPATTTGTETKLDHVPPIDAMSKAPLQPILVASSNGMAAAIPQCRHVYSSTPAIETKRHQHVLVP